MTAKYVAMFATHVVTASGASVAALNYGVCTPLCVAGLFAVFAGLMVGQALIDNDQDPPGPDGVRA